MKFNGTLECACAQGREPGNSVQTQGLGLRGTAGNVQCARKAAGLSTWCTQQVKALKTPRGGTAMAAETAKVTALEEKRDPSGV